MSDIDWSEAPEGATHFEVGSENPWEKHGDGNPMFFSALDRRWLSLGSTATDSPDLVARPVALAYDGTTLPPVGTVCEYKTIQDDDWITVKITGYGDNLALMRPHGKDYETICSKAAARFRTIKSDRDRAIDEMYEDSIAAEGRLAIAAAIYDAGYRKVQS